MRELSRSGHALLLYYVLQQVQQFRRLGEDFAMQHTDYEFLVRLEEQLQMALLESLSVEQRLQGLSPEQLVQHLSPEERVQGLTPEERVQGLSPEECVQELSRGLSAEELVACLNEEQAERLGQLLELNNPG